MTMSPRDWRDLASVYQAGADAQRGYIMNTERQQQADALEAMAVRCEELAVERNMTDQQLEEAEYARRQSLVPHGSRLQCKVYVPDERRHGTMGGLCRLHKDHVLDETPHTMGPEPASEDRLPGRSFS